MRFFKSDDEVKVISNEKEKKEILEFLSKDQWSEPIIRECFVHEVYDAPLFFPQLREELVLNNSGAEYKTKGIDSSDEELQETASSTGLLMVYPFNGELVVKPTRYTAFTSICARAGIQGTTITNMYEKPLLHVLPLEEKAHWLSRGLSLHEGFCKILYRDGKVSAMLSNDYNIMPAHIVVPLMERTLKKEFPDLAFKEGTFSHEYLVLEYMLNASEMEENFRMQLLEYNCKADSVKVGIRFSTSDIGHSKVTAAPILYLNNVSLRMGEPVAVTHLQSSSIEKFIEGLGSIAENFKESEELIEELGNTEIRYPSHCFANIVAEHTALKSGSEQIIEELEAEFPFGTTATAIDIYFALSRIIEVRNNKKQLSPTTIVNLSDVIAKLLKINYKDYDKIIVNAED